MTLDGSAKSDLERTAQQWKGWSVEGVARKAIAYIEQLETQVPKWISVEERLPEESGYYLYLCDSPIRGLQNGVGVSYFQHKAKLWKKVYNPCVTHWMPLPETPEEGE